MASEEQPQLYGVEVGGSLLSKRKSKLNKNYIRDKNRNFRGKRSKSRHYNKHRKFRVKKEQNLCEGTVSVYNIADDMEQPQQSEYSPQLPKDVSDWQYYHQLAFWKSRAIALEYENKMLHSHIKKMCTQQIQDYVNYVKDDEENNYVDGYDEDSYEYQLSSEDINENDVSEESSNVNTGIRPWIPVTSEDSLLYGDTEDKINGMETAMKVNYDMNIDKYKPTMWPNIPLQI